jgi:arylsulfatase A-like enzyme
LVAPVAAAEKPHIVLFLADDLTWDDVEPYGSKDVRTPNLTALAKDSLKFERAFSPSPTCTPCRSALYTGLYPMRNGAHANHSFVKDGVRTLPHYMKELGYRVVIAGKTHIGHRDNFPFEYLPDSNVMPEGRKEFLWTDLSTRAVDKLLGENDPQKQPLCLIVAAHSPHVFWLPNEGMYKPKQIHLPPTFVDGPVTRRERCNYYRDVTHMDTQVGEVLASLERHGYAGNTMFLFTADQGAQWPFAKWSLYDAGMRVPLIVRWPGHVKPGTTTGTMVTLIDLLPTFVEAAGGTAPEGIDGKSVLPVLRDASRQHRDEVYAAHTGDKEMNQAPMRCVRTGKWKYIHNLRPDVEYHTHVSSAGEKDGGAYFAEWIKKAKADPKAKAIVDRFYHLPAEELYDVESDPYELKNLAGDPAHAATVKELRGKVDAWRVQQGEDLKKAPMPEDAVIGNPRYAG